VTELLSALKHLGVVCAFFDRMAEAPCKRRADFISECIFIWLEDAYSGQM